MADTIENRMGGRTIFQNFGFLTLGRSVGDAFTFLMFVVLSRVFGQKGIGDYSFAMSLTGFFVVFAEFGLYHLSIKELSWRDGPLGVNYSPMLSLRLILSAIVFALLLFALPFLPVAYDIKLIVVIIGVYQLMQKLAEGATAVFVARQDTHLAGIIEASQKAVAALTVIAVVVAGGSLVMALVTLPVVTAGQIVVAYNLVTRKYGRPLLATSLSSLIQTIRQTLPYGLSGLSIWLFRRTDVVLLGFLLGTAAVGVYNVAYRVVFFLMFIPQFASVSLFPVAARLYKNSENDLQDLFHKTLNIIILIGFPISAGLWLVSGDIIELIFGEAFSASAIILQLLAGLLFLNFLSRVLGIFLMSCDCQVERTKSQWIVACVNVLGNLFLIPVLGLKGAAIATLVSESLLVILFAVRLRGIFGWPRIGLRLVIGCMGVTSFYLPFTLFPVSSLGVVIPASVLLYTTTLMLFREIRENEGRLLMGLLKSES